MSTIKADAITASTGTNTNIAITGKGSGKVKLGDGNLLFPDADGSANQYIKTDGGGNLAFATLPVAAAGLTFISKTDISGDPTSVELTIPATHQGKIIIMDLVSIGPASDSGTSMTMQCSSDGGSTLGTVWFGAASTITTAAGSSSNGGYVGSSSGATSATLFTTVRSPSSGIASGARVIFWNGTNDTQCRWTFSSESRTVNSNKGWWGGGRAGMASDLDWIKLIWGSSAAWANKGNINLYAQENS